VDRREEARAAAVSEERLPRVAHAGPAGDGDLCPNGAKRNQKRRLVLNQTTPIAAPSTSAARPRRT
jgi:hypothetical protein